MKELHGDPTGWQDNRGSRVGIPDLTYRACTAKIAECAKTMEFWANWVYEPPSSPWRGEATLEGDRHYQMALQREEMLRLMAKLRVLLLPKVGKCYLAGKG